jgi:hypothetical protein
VPPKTDLVSFERQHVGDLRIANESRRPDGPLLYVAQHCPGQPQPGGRLRPGLASYGSGALEMRDSIGCLDVLRQLQLTQHRVPALKPACQLVDDITRLRQQLSGGSRIAHLVSALTKKPDAPMADMQARPHAVTLVRR